MAAAVTDTQPRSLRLRSRYVAVRDLLGRLPMSVILLGLRVAVGFVFFNSGMLKLRSFEFAVKLFEQEYQLPLIDPVLATRLALAVEVTVPLFLFLGLATRLATLPLLGMVAVIQLLVYPQAWTEHLLWASSLVLLLTRGPGLFSLDHLIERRLAGSPA